MMNQRKSDTRRTDRSSTSEPSPSGVSGVRDAHSKMKRASILSLLAVVVAGSGFSAACGPEFTSCYATRSCPSTGGEAGATFEPAGGAGDATGGSSSGGSGPQGGNPDIGNTFGGENVGGMSDGLGGTSGGPGAAGRGSAREEAGAGGVPGGRWWDGGKQPRRHCREWRSSQWWNYEPRRWARQQREWRSWGAVQMRRPSSRRKLSPRPRWLQYPAHSRWRTNYGWSLSADASGHLWNL